MSSEKQKKSKQQTRTGSSAKKRKKKKKQGSQSTSSKSLPKKSISQPVEPSTVQKIVSFVFNLLFYVVTIGLILSAVLFAFNDNEEKNIMGYQVFNVKTNSMVPRDPKKQKDGFKAGDVIVIKKIKGSEVQKGDVVTFHPSKDSPTYLTHRVVKVVDELNDMAGPFMITQGDANLTEDAPTPVDQVVGKKVFVIPRLGMILQFVREHIIVTAVFILSVFGSIILLKVYLSPNNAAKEASNHKSKSRHNRKSKSKRKVQA